MKTKQYYWSLYLFVILLLCLCGSSIASASVEIHEVAWMGSTASSYDEWIELVNTGNSSIDLDGWTLSWSDRVIHLGSVNGDTKEAKVTTIPDKGFFLLERTDDDSSDKSADIIYTGTLGNDGEHMILKNSNGDVVDDLSYVGGWPAGDNKSKETMQRGSSGWYTAQATPKAKNAQQSTDSSGGTDKTEDSDDDTNAIENSNEPTTVTTIEGEDRKDTVTYTMNVLYDSVIIAGEPMEFEVDVRRNNALQIHGLHEWNFGDGVLRVDNKKTTAGELVSEHVYEYPGVYQAVFSYRTSHLKPEPDVVHKKRITVITPDIELRPLYDEEKVKIYNHSEVSVPIGGWELHHGNTVFSFPRYTSILPEGSITLSFDRLGFSLQRIPISLYLSSGVKVAQSQTKKKEQSPPHETASSSDGVSVMVSQKETPYIDKEKAPVKVAEVTHSTVSRVVATRSTNTVVLASSITNRGESEGNLHKQTSSLVQLLPWITALVIVIGLGVGGIVWATQHTATTPSNKEDVYKVTLLRDKED